MKIGRRILSVALIAAVCASAAVLPSCKKHTAKIRNLDTVPLSEERRAAMDSENDTIRVIFPGLDEGVDEWRNSGVARFEQDTGKTVEYVPSGFAQSEIADRLYSSIAAKNPYDAIWTTTYETGINHVKQYTQPIGDYVNLEWLEENELINYTIMDEFAKFDGEYTLIVPYDFVNPFFCFYNCNLIEKFDLDDPKELYKKNEWTVSAMLDMAAKATEDADKDGINDTYGITTSYENIWDSMNHTAMVKTDADGKYLLNLDDPAFLRSLDYYRDMMYTKKVRGTQDGMPVNAFGTGKYLFLLDAYWSTWEIQQLDPAPAFEWDAVPLPYGVDNTEHYNTVSSAGMSFVSGCRNPYTTATLIEYLCQECSAWQKEIDEQYISVSEKYTDIQKMKDELCEKPYYSFYYDNLIYKMGQDMLQSVAYGNDNTTAIEKFRAQYQGDLNLINAQVIWPEVVDHDPYVFDFESDISMFSLSDSVKSGELVQTTGEDAIDGGSMKLTYDASANAKTLTLLTLSEEYRLYGYTTYQVTFDYRPEGEIPADAQYFIAYCNAETGKQKDAVFFTPSLDSSGIGHAEVTLNPLSDDTTVYTMLIGSRNASGGLVIDNMRIEQVRTVD